MAIPIKKITEVIQYIYKHKDNVTARDVMHKFSNEHGNKEVDEILAYLISEKMIRIDMDNKIQWLYVPEVEGLNERFED